MNAKEQEGPDVTIVCKCTGCKHLETTSTPTHFESGVLQHGTRHRCKTYRMDISPSLTTPVSCPHRAINMRLVTGLCSTYSPEKSTRSSSGRAAMPCAEQTKPYRSCAHASRTCPWAGSSTTTGAFSIQILAKAVTVTSALRSTTVRMSTRAGASNGSVVQDT